MSDYTVMLSAARAAVVEASRVCREIQRNMEKVKAILKDDKSPVTIADYASQAVVAHALAIRLGKINLVGEETSAQLRNPENAPALKATLEAARSVWGEATERSLLDAIDMGASDTRHAGFWTLDPIDGTKGFLRNQQYAVSLAFVERGQVAVGVLGCPNLPKNFNASLDVPDVHGCLYFAIKGQGVYETGCDRADAPPTRIMRLDPAEGRSVSICSSVEKAHSSEDDMDRVVRLLGSVGEPARLDSQAKYAVVARGQADAYLRLPTKKDYVERIWDHAAGSLIATESGCFVTDIHGRALDFSCGRGLEKNRGVVCAPPRVHGKLIGAIEKVGLK